MPKIIENLREEILKYGKTQLLREGYKALTIRKVATGCNIATGTMYNYFASKDVLVASIIFQDWENTLRNVKQSFDGVTNCLDGLHLIFDAIHDFSVSYQNIWHEYGSLTGLNNEYHEHLIQQLCDVILPLLEQYHPNSSPDPTRFLAENILYASTKSDMSFDSLKPFIEKIL